jgi:hypothetical protein
MPLWAAAGRVKARVDRAAAKAAGRGERTIGNPYATLGRLARIRPKG